MADNQESVKRQFGQAATAYVASRVHAQGASLARLVELTQPQKDWRVLDVSTGGGHTALAFAPHVKQVVASDVTPEMLAAAEKFIREQGNANIEFKIADAENLPFADDEFDLVTNRLALHHYPDAFKAIREMARVVKRGGRVALADNTVPPHKQTAGYINHFEKLRDPSHNWCYPRARLENYFADAGLVVEHAETDALKELDFADWVTRMNCSDATVAELTRRLDNAPPEVKDFFKPREVEGRRKFSLEESIIVARKP